MTFRRLAFAIGSLLCIFFLLCVNTGLAQTSDFEADQSLTAEVLSKTLYAKTSAEKEYCVYVIEQRNSGNLTNKVLYGAYRYAVEKEKARRFIYFKTALENLSRREGLTMKNETPKTQTWSPLTLVKTTSAAPAATPASTSSSTTKKPFAFLFRLLP